MKMKSSSKITSPLDLFGSSDLVFFFLLYVFLYFVEDESVLIEAMVNGLL